MKSLFAPLLAAAWLASAAPARLQGAETIPEIITLQGRTFRQCEIVRVHPDGVSFRHATGAARVLFSDLSSEWRGRLGYDPEKAAAHRQEQKELAEKREEARKARAAVEEARFRELAEAAARARIQIMGQEAQARALARRQASSATSVVPVLPALGAVHDPYQDRRIYERTRQLPFLQPHGWPGYGYGDAWGYGFGIAIPGWRSCHPLPPACPPRPSITIRLPLR
ncbi:MAG: hypothetical protein CJBNEKGG_03737 [Prosthecobacter sp.]|nr:hypothetical protein [Prosthecobacter sp.]